ncbi:co-chaperone GroES [candidate division WWE3 bacterium RIFOXYC1_FULL_40_10]|uniref:Co-chaperonin GroES n=1 Tax=candidate division WWE3 bacterium RIFOXYA2_FULL_46_9 TaxID=1802636 RepID=A0A1F4W0U0_UNCKA|nr:MAG: co-chaperone GroES [candidate division WWE3 bacterium RIFOXYB1_FULL_40_22]OGC62052.1 MAG: co-chaperone GroES [candidate division WWE3 bacterium RIFOXYA1_FULL_40_11]OGC62970.1 MAG: co-chaperone GroES [candidate division WWE3 bacterium RIFOXYA2_FULL_46_9]OGC65003.1 MAG: co-chaperone GroES [candidate division WWE3 bacterium RIFOXYB2_FULL_41_6]OGC66435.1 MAG: co-chaperone GroES [candidate division WWE3 bacterium RIFOXYC1_FULL_40_10]OGC67241.1 MAG: co-chaperone GroES [candidate division WWE
MITLNKIKPLADNVLIEPLQKETTTPSGIFIPDTVNKEKPQEGKIVAAGPGRKDEDGKLIEMQVKVGNVVMYKKWGGTEIKVEGKEVLLVKEEDILAIVEE